MATVPHHELASAFGSDVYPPPEATSSTFPDTGPYGNDSSTEVEYQSPGASSEWDGFGQTSWIYFAPIIFVTGVTGNVLILIIMARRKFQGTTTCVYLRAMALADLLVLLTGMLPEWVSATFKITFKLLTPITCKAEKFFQYSIGDTAIWILVAFTVDRFTAVCFPLRKNDMCKPSRSRYICLALLLVSFSKNFHVFWTRGLEYVTGENGQEVFSSNCARPEPYKTFETYIRPWIAFALISVVPFIIIVFCNSMIIRALIIAKNATLSYKVQSNQEKTYTQLTFMCLSASFAFLVFITPSIVLLIGKPYWKKDNVAYDVSKAVNNQLTYVNHSINFFLYCISGKRFRKELCRMCSCRRRRSLSYMETSTESKTTLYRINPATPVSLKKEAKNGFYNVEKDILLQTERPEVVDKRESSV